MLQNLLSSLARNLTPADRAVRYPDRGVQQAKIVVNFGDRSNRGARTAAGGLLLDGDCRTQSIDRIDVGTLHLVQKLARIRRQRLDIPALSLGIDGIEGER